MREMAIQMGRGNQEESQSPSEQAAHPSPAFSEVSPQQSHSPLHP
jgi:hypothetical protein